MIKDKLKELPNNPGCYLMKNSDDEVIYVGKAKNLSNRVRSYFTGSHNAKTTRLVQDIKTFEFIITSTEKEAFILEMNLIKKYNPKYNIMLTDDKRYPYIAVSNEKNPKIYYTRDLGKKAKYFGPYPNAKAAKEVCDMLNKMYPLRKCNKIPKKECLYYHIGQCLAPCIRKVEDSEYKDIVNKLNLFLKGNVKDEIKRLTKLMNEASEKLEFEIAMEYLNLIENLKAISERQKMEFDINDADAVAKAKVRMDEFKTKYYNPAAINAFKENNLPISWIPSCHANNVWLKLMKDEGIWDNSAVIDSHYYSNPRMPDNKYTWNGPDTMTAVEYGLERMKAAAAQYGDNKLFVMGETGFPTSSLDIRSQADFNTRIGILGLANGSDIINFYCMYDRTSYFTGTSNWEEMHFGAFYNFDFYGVTKPKPWAAAYGTMTRMLDGVDTVVTSEKYDNYSEEYRMTNAGGNTKAFDVTMKNGEKMIAAWTNIYAVNGSTSETKYNGYDPILPWENQWKKNGVLQTEEVTFDAVADTVTVTDTMGNITEYTPINGKVTIPLTGSPVYIKGVE